MRKQLASMFMAGVMLFGSIMSGIPATAAKFADVSLKADTKVKVACVGDSITYGDKTTTQAIHSYPSQLGALLGDRYEVKNYGINAATMVDASWCPRYLNTNQSKECQAYQPDVIIVMLGTNDSQDICWIGDNAQNTYEPTARELIQTYKNLPSRPKVIVATSPTAGAGNQFGIRPDVIDNTIVPMQKRLAAELDCPVIDINAMTKDFHSRGLMTETFNGKPDLVHPNDAGYLELAKLMKKGLDGILGIADDTIEIDCNNQRVKYEGTWGDWPDPALYAGTEKFTTAAGSSATLAFEGCGVMVTGIRTPFLSMMDVYIDDVLVQTSDTYIPENTAKKHEPIFAIDSLPRGPHTLKVVLSNQKLEHHKVVKLSLDSFVIYQVPQGFVDKINIQSASGEYLIENGYGSLQLSADVTPFDAKNKEVAWSVSPAASGSITQDGLLTAKISEGSLTVTAEAKDGTLRAASKIIKVGDMKNRVLVDDRDAAVAYTGSWTDRSSTGLYHETAKVTRSAGDSSTYTFTGTGIQVIGELHPIGERYSYADVEIDGVYAGAATFIHNKDDVGIVPKEVVFEALDLKPGSHTIKLTAKNNKSGAPAGGSCGVALDGFMVYDKEKAVNYAPLKAAMADARISYANATAGGYSAQDAAALNAAIEEAADDLETISTQAQANAAEAALKKAVEAFAATVQGTRKITVTAPAHAKIALTAAGDTKSSAEVANGDRVTLTITPDEQYQVSGIVFGAMQTSVPQNADGSVTITFTATSNLQIVPQIEWKKIKIACVGDSISYGACSTNPQINGYPAQLQKLLGGKYDVQNFAMPSACLRPDGNFPYDAQSVAIQSKNFEPDIVIIMLGTNDSTSANWNNYGAQGFKADTAAMVQSYRDLPSQPTVYLATAPFTYDGGRGPVIEAEVAPATRQSAAELNCPLIDMYQKTENLSKLFFFGDYIHFNDLGYELMAQFMLEGLNLTPQAAMTDRSELLIADNRCKDTQQSDCTPATWSAFASARAAAQTVLENTQAKQSDLTIALRVLQDALGKLRFNNTIKVACVGDSITYGWRADPRETNCYPARLQKLLGNQYVVTNYGVNGRTMNDQIGDRYTATSAYTDSKNANPDVVIIMLGTNDSKNKNWQSVDRFKESARTLINTYKNLPSHPKVYLATSPAVDPDMLGSGDPEADIIRDYRIKDLIAPAQRELAAETGCTLIEINEKTNNLEDLYSFLSDDMIHPDNAGYAMLTGYMYNGLKGTTPADLSSLKAELAAAQKMDQEAYTVQSVEVLNAAIAHAKKIVDNDMLTSLEQQVVEDARQTLSQAIAQLDTDAPAPVVNKSTLELVLGFAQKHVDNGDVDKLVPSAKEKFKQEFEKAGTVYNDPKATQEQVDTAWVKLMYVIHGLGFVSGNMTQLEAQVTASGEIKLDQYADGTEKDVFVAALKHAEDTLKNPEAMQDEIDRACADLKTAMDNLKPLPVVGDKSELEKVLKVANEYDLSKYVDDENKTAFIEVREVAQALYDSTAAVTQGEINKVRLELLAAMASLRLRADKESLQEWIDTLKGMDLTKYTQESADALLLVLNKAESLAAQDLGKEEQALIEAMILEMQLVQNNLVKAEDPEKPGDSSEPENSEMDENTSSADTNSESDKAPTTGDGMPVVAVSLLAAVMTGVLLIMKKRVNER